MMNDILKQIKAGEVSGVQFKERILDKYDIACELVAFSNSHGGKLVGGDKLKVCYYILLPSLFSPIIK